jgi:hypothetical protein
LNEKVVIYQQNAYDSVKAQSDMEIVLRSMLAENKISEFEYAQIMGEPVELAVESKAPVYLKTTDGQTFGRGASVLFAGNNRWVSQYSMNPCTLYDGMDRTMIGDVRATDAQGRPIEWWGAGQHGVGADGTLIYCPRYHEGRSVIVELSDRTTLIRDERVLVTTTSVIDRNAAVCWAAAKPSHVWFWNGEYFKEYPIAFPSYGGSIFRGSDQKIYLVYASGKFEYCIVHKLEDPTKGWWFGREEKAYNGCGWTDMATGKMWIAWSENAGATSESVIEKELTGLAQPWPAKPIIIPAFEKTALKIGVGLFDDLKGPRIIDYSEKPSSNVEAVFWDIRSGETKDEAKRLAASLKVGAEAYRDGYGMTVTQVPSGFRALVFAYPSAAISVDESVNKVKAVLKEMKAKHIPRDMALAMYCQYRAPGNYALPLQKVLDTLTKMWSLGIDYEVGAMWCFTKYRRDGTTLVDGVDYWPELQEALDRMKKASGNWEWFPPFSSAIPPIEPPKPPVGTRPWFPKMKRFM